MGHVLRPDFVLRELEPNEAGFDYALALTHVLRFLSYDEAAGFMGYESKSSVSRILEGAIPPHPQGERLYILYVEMFGAKPALRVPRKEHVTSP